MNMNLDEKKELVRLLHLYMDDIMRQYEVYKRNGSLAVHVGIKSQFDHARVIANKLEREISTNLLRF